MLHELKDLLQRRVARAPRHVACAVRGRLPILQMNARDPVVEFPQKQNRALAGSGHVVTEIDVRHVCLRRGERLIEGGHAALKMGVIRRVDLPPLRERASPSGARGGLSRLSASAPSCLIGTLAGRAGAAKPVCRLFRSACGAAH